MPLRTIRCFFSPNAILASGMLWIATLAVSASAAQITIPTVPVGNAGNAADPLTGFGAVAYDYRIGTTEVTNMQYVAFLNAVATTDTHGLYHAEMESSPYGGITRTGSSGNYSYSVKADAGSYTYANKPVVYVSWGDAARFANWLHNGQPTGAQNASTTEDGAYALNGAMTNANLSTVTRNANATWFLPSEDEWYKAAYQQPAAQGGDSDDYWLYPTASNSVPNNVHPVLDTGNSANFYGGGYATGDAHYHLTDAGAYTLSASPYGTYDQGGNVWEWNEALISSSYRGYRGGSFGSDVDYLQSSNWADGDPTLESPFIGFRMATVPVPEPSTAVLAALGLTGLLWWSKRRK